MKKEDTVVVKVRPPDSAESATVSCSMVDMSNRGLRLLLKELAPPGTRLSLWVKRLDGPGTLTLEGIVRWCQAAETAGHWVGVELQDISEANLAVWQHMLAGYRHDHRWK